jgi:prefoldin subunit 5
MDSKDNEIQILQEKIKQLEKQIDSLQAQLGNIPKRPKIDVMSEEVVDTNPYR